MNHATTCARRPGSWPVRCLFAIPSLLLLLTSSLLAQSFTISASPEISAPTGENAVFTVTAAALDGFKATVFLSASAPTLPSAKLDLKPAEINHPYSTKATLTVTVTTVIDRPQPIVVTGRNGAVIVHDTVMLAGRAVTGWSVYDTTNSPIPGANITALVVDRNGVGWIGTQRGLASFDGTTWNVHDIPLTYGVHSLAVDSNNALWVGGYNNIYRYHENRWTRFNDTLIGELTGGKWWYYTNKIEADPAGNVWFAGTHYGGVLKYNGGAWSYYDTSNSEIGKSFITAMTVNHAGELWLASDAGLMQFDGRFWTLHKQINGIDLYSPSLLKFDRSGILWLRTGYNGALMKVAGESTTLYQETPWNHFPGYHVMSIAFDNRGHIWTGHEMTDNSGYYPLRCGLARVRGWDGAERVAFNPTNSGIPENHVTMVVAADDGKIWMATATRGLAILDATTVPEGQPSDVDEQAGDDATTARLSVRPNPMTDRATVRIAPAKACRACLTLIDARGEEVARLLDEDVRAGERFVELDAAEIPAGAYFLRLVTPEGVTVRPVMVR